MSENNLKLWERVEETDPNATKKVSYGTRSFTTIDAYHQIKQATQIFGLYGQKWGLESIDIEFINGLDKQQVLAVAKAVFFYTIDDNRVSFPINGSIMVQEFSHSKKYLMLDSEFTKKVETDILTKALSKLGFAADVFMGRYDDNKYINQLKEKYKDVKPEPKKKASTPPPPKRGSEIPNKGQRDPTTVPSSKKPLKMAIKKDVDKIVELIKAGHYSRAKAGIKYWETGGRGISDPQKQMLINLIYTLSGTPKPKK